VSTNLLRLRVLFDILIDLPPGERAAALDQLSGPDLALRADVEAIIAKSERAESSLDRPLIPSLAAAATLAPTLIGQRIGPYTVVRLIGMGGMGAVYEASRADEQYDKRVAIKIVQRDIDSETTLARFRRERQILASLDHPNIATLHDGGVMADGRPFLVMEYVDGAPITTWCSEHALPLRGRLALFRQVCAAVHHAHRNLVIHRDLKPANILVTQDGTVKLLDFGIAQLVSEAATDTASEPLTRGGARAYTPEYASPEQIRGDTLTTATDVYSLGVVLFELLTGVRPHRLTSRALVDIERAVLETPVPRPSAAVTAEGAALGPQHLARTRHRLRGEVDSITLMALQQEPARRYASAEAFGQDVQHYLDGEPVRAQPEWFGYRASKFVRRNRAASAATAAALTALVAGVVLATTAAHRARVSETKATQANLFLTQLLASVRPELGSRDAKVSDVLDVAARRVDRDFASAPEVRAELESVIGNSYEGLGRYDEAERHLKNALTLEQRLSGDASTPAITSLSDLGRLYVDRGTLDSARAAFESALALQQSQGIGGDTLRAELLSNLGSLAHSEGHAAESERYHRQALAIRERLGSDSSDDVAVSLTDLGVAIGEQGRVAEAEALHRRALAIARANSAQPNERLAGVLGTLAAELDMEGKTAAADSAYRETLAMQKQVLGADHPDYALMLFNYSGFVFDQKRYQDAADYSREVLALRGKTLDESQPAVAGALQTLGRSLDQVGDHHGGEAALMESLALRKKYNPADSWVIPSGESALGEHYTLTHDYPRAESLLLHAQQALTHELGANDGRTVRNTKRLVALYTAWRKPGAAAEWARQVPR
jgi:serine/threonine protein kinase/Tfp pilus assembly protein PilF